MIAAAAGLPVRVEFVASAVARVDCHHWTVSNAARLWVEMWIAKALVFCQVNLEFRPEPACATASSQPSETQAGQQRCRGSRCQIEVWAVHVGQIGDQPDLRQRHQAARSRKQSGSAVVTVAEAVSEFQVFRARLSRGTSERSFSPFPPECVEQHRLGGILH